MSDSPSSGDRPAWQVDVEHRLQPAARQRSSPHTDPRPVPDDIGLVVIHNISLPPGVFGGRWIDDLFMGVLDPDAHPYFAGLRGLRVSAHLLIDRRARVTQYVPFDRRAWHAGVSSWNGRQRCNDFSVGIELEGSDQLPFTDAQYTVLGDVLTALVARYPRLNADTLAGHSDIAPGRKTDPGPHFDWPRLRRLLVDSA